MPCLPHLAGVGTASNGNGNTEPTVVFATVPSFPEALPIHLEEWKSLVACGAGECMVVMIDILIPSIELVSISQYQLFSSV